MHISLFLGFITSVYTINDGNFLLFTDSREGEIYKMNLSTYISEPLFGFHPNPVAISFDKAKKRIYWSDNGLRQLKSGDLEGKTNRVVRYLGNDSVVDGISIDSVSRLLFFTDSGYSSISVVTLDGNNYQKKIIKEAWISQDQLFPITKLGLYIGRIRVRVQGLKGPTMMDQKGKILLRKAYIGQTVW